MESSLFESLYASYLHNFDDNRGWKELSKEYGYVTGEALRSAFKRERRARSLPSKNDLQSNIKPEIKKVPMPKIGVMDIESLPLLAYCWSLWDQNIGINQIAKDMCLLSWAGKFLNESKIYSDILKPEECEERLDKRIVESAHDFVSKCDYIIGHNFNEFDGKILNTLFLRYGLLPVKYKIIDTLIIAKSNFRFTSRKLDFINTKLGIRNKLSTDFELWSRCDKGDKQSLDEMLKYNFVDIYATEELFYKVRPYVNNINVSLYNETEECQCPNCGNTELEHEGFYYTKVSKFETLRCEKCGAVSRKRENLVSKEKKKNLLQSF